MRNSFEFRKLAECIFPMRRGLIHTLVFFLMLESSLRIFHDFPVYLFDFLCKFRMSLKDELTERISIRFIEFE